MEKELTYTLIARKPGEYSIGPFTIKYKGKQIRSNSLNITVKKGVRHKKQNKSSSQQTPQFNFDFGIPSTHNYNRNGSYTVEFLSGVNKTKVLQGEEIILTYKIVRDISFATNPNIDFPDFKGFWKEDMDEVNPYYITRNGKRYIVNEIKFALFPTKNGRITIPRSTLSAYVNTFFIDPFSGGNEKIERKTKPITIEVAPIKGDTANFSGGVGIFQISDSLVADSVNVGEPLIRVIIVRGIGNLPLIQKPMTSYPPSFRVFNSKVEQNLERKDDIRGSVRFKEMVIPEKGGKFVLPGVSFKYFNTKLNKMITLKTDSLHVTVKNVISQGETGGEIQHSDNILKLTEKEVHSDSVNKYLLYFYFLAIFIFVLIFIIKLLDMLGIKIAFFENRRRNINSSRMKGKIKKFESSGEYKRAVALIKEAHLWGANPDENFIKDCDKLLFKPKELSRDEYFEFKKKYGI